MKQLSLRGFDRDLERRLKDLARSQGISLNKAALVLLRKGAGLEEARARKNIVGDSLDHLIGKWSKEEEQAILEATKVFEQIDESLWS